MNNLPRQMLRRIVTKYGSEVCSDAKRCESLLNDLCGANRREINVLVTAIDERVPLDLLAANDSMPRELLFTKLEKRLEEQTALTAEAAQWAVESWALALGAATETEIEERRGKKSDSPTVKSATIQPTFDEENKVENINRANPPPIRKSPPPKIQPRTPPIQQFPQFPQNAPPPPSRIPAPHNSPVNQSPAQTIPKAQSFPNQSPPTNPTAVSTAPKRSFGFFRGCLIFIFLVIVLVPVLFFGVPFAIEKMRETQRERSTEPPRFPVR